MPISLGEDMLGYDATEIYIPNLIFCGGVIMRLNDGGFAGMHLTPDTTEEQIRVAAHHTATQIANVHGGIHDIIFFVSRTDWNGHGGNLDTAIAALQEELGVALVLKAKQNSVPGQWSTDVRVQTNLDQSWIAVRPHVTGPQTAVVPINNNVYRIKRNTTPPTVVVANLQAIPNDLTGFDV